MMMPSHEQMGKTTEDMNNFVKNAWDMALKSASVMTKGWEETVRTANTMIQESLNRAMSASQTMASAKTPKEMMDIHAEHMKESFDHFIAGTGKISEISARTTKEMMGPMADNANTAMSKMYAKTRAA